MKRIELYLWRTKWAGKWGVTRHLSTEEEILKTNPEAIRVEGSLVVRMIPETEEERAEVETSNSFNPWRDVRTK